MQLFLLIVAFVTAASAQADTTAVYRNTAAKFSMTVKIASNGDIRAEAADRIYYSIGGQDYFADRTDGGVIVMKVDDIAAIMREQFAKLGDPRVGSPPLTLVPNGSIPVGKWAGTAYYRRLANGQLSTEPEVVISDDPTLTALGKAMTRQYGKSIALLDKVTGHALISNMDQILNSGAPISLAGAELESADFNPIPKDEFILPAKPATIDQIRKHEGLQ